MYVVPVMVGGVFEMVKKLVLARVGNSVPGWNTAPLMLAAYIKQIWAFKGKQIKTGRCSTIHRYC